ncbi:MAG: potassium-transporting ATPase subunit F [Knoellia sp.]
MPYPIGRGVHDGSPADGPKALALLGDRCVVRAPRSHVHQERVRTCQGAVKGGSARVAESLTAEVIENLIGAIAGIAVLAYLVYALIRPDKF